MTDPWGRRWATPAAFVLLWIAVAAVYARVLHGDWVFDDAAIWADPIRRLDHFSWDGLWKATSGVLSERSRWIPNATFALNFLWFGGGTTSFHVVNVVIHALASLALFGFVRETLRLDGRSEEASLRVALLTAALFALNPVQTQAVSYIWQRSASLAGLFVFATMWILARGLRRTGARRLLLLAGAGALGFASLFVKQNTIALAAVIPLYAWLFASRRSLTGLVIAGGTLGVAAAVALVAVAPYIWGYLTPWEGVQKALGESAGRFATHLLTQSRVVLRLASLVIAPLPGRLSIDHRVIDSHGLATPWTTLPATGTVVVLVALAIAGARRRPLVSFCIFWWFVTLAPESMIVSLVPMFEHRAYVPSAGLLLLVALAIDGLGSGSPHRPRVAVGVAAIVLALFAAGTWSRNGVWTSQLALSEDAARKAPLHPRPHWNVGASWEAEGWQFPPKTRPHEEAWDRAEAAFQRAWELDPRNLQFQDSLAHLQDLRGRGGSSAEIPTWLILSTDDRHLVPDSAAIYDALDRTLASALGEWSPGRVHPDGEPGLPSSDALRAAGARAFWLTAHIGRLQVRTQDRRIRVKCRILAKIYDWRGADLGPGSRNLALSDTGEGSAPDRESGRRDAEIDCAKDAVENLVAHELTATLGRLAWFQDRASRESEDR